MRRASVVLACLTAALALGGCGGDDEPAVNSGGTTAAEATTEAAATTSTTTAATTESTTGGSASTVGCVEVSAPQPEPRSGTKPTGTLDASTVYEVTMKTNCGSFTITLEEGGAKMIWEDVHCDVMPGDTSVPPRRAYFRLDFDL